ncbi:murein biosynthesis integral membrane protein MurJ [Cellulomonas sp. S1-8]|uniref:murein biosynthesis integral membrane protein MurJ n=1 Tax=Cellulomonas sp. S1-8 TaxID=2904790 RepID=UPI00224451EB|nr:lipid II flippase MurJ [Cellulomonas sp. S1-8]UZN05002.1 virulence factor MviN [Cellulomonas sp. S1-8]
MSTGVRRALQGLVGAAAMIAAVTVVSRVLGLVRTLVQASTVGYEAIADAYSAANLLPTVLFEVAAGGALAGAVVPLLAGPVARADREQVARVVSAALGWVLLVLVPVGLLLAALSGVIGEFAGKDAVMTATVRFFVLVFSVQVPVYGLTVLLYGVLQAHQRFFWPAFAPVLNSLVLIATFAVYGALADGETRDPTALAAGALDVLAWGTTAGVIAMCLPVIRPARRLGVRLTPTLRFPGDAGTRFRALALAGVGSVAAQQVSVLVIWVMANGLLPHDGRGFSSWVYSQQVYLLPYAVLVVPLATSTFPRVAAYAAAGDGRRFALMSAVTTRAVLAVGALGGAAVLAAAAAAATVFARLSDGEDARFIEAMTVLLTWTAPGLVGLAVMFHVSRTLYAVERPRAAIAANVVGWGSVAVLAPALLVVTGTEGTEVLRAIGLATSLGMTAGGIAAVVALRRTAGGSALSGMVRTALVALGAACVGAFAGRAVASTVLDLVGDDALTATGAAAGAAVVAATVVAAAVVLLDRSTLTGIVSLERTPGPGAGAARR